MNQSLLLQLPRLLDDLSDHGWAQVPNAVSTLACQALVVKLLERFSSGAFTQALIGRNKKQSENQSIRSDTIHWLENSDPNPSIKFWMKEVADLAIALNESFFLSINSYESHFACYEPGTSYQKHVDRFRDDPGRLLSIILFLNEDWLDGDDGELLIYDPLHPQQVIAEIRPEMGTLVVFQSDRILHEVRKTNRRRLSLTGWLKSLNAHEAFGQGILPPPE